MNIIDIILFDENHNKNLIVRGNGYYSDVCYLNLENIKPEGVNQWFLDLLDKNPNAYTLTQSTRTIISRVTYKNTKPLSKEYTISVINERKVSVEVHFLYGRISINTTVVTSGGVSIDDVKLAMKSVDLEEVIDNNRSEFEIDDLPKVALSEEHWHRLMSMSLIEGLQ